MPPDFLFEKEEIPEFKGETNRDLLEHIFSLEKMLEESYHNKKQIRDFLKEADPHTLNELGGPNEERIFDRSPQE